jgi:hypothetical protein
VNTKKKRIAELENETKYLRKHTSAIKSLYWLIDKVVSEPMLAMLEKELKKLHTKKDIDKYLELKNHRDDLKELINEAHTECIYNI